MKTIDTLTSLALWLVDFLKFPILLLAVVVFFKIIITAIIAPELLNF